MNDSILNRIKGRIWRRIIVKSVVFALWAGGLVFLALQRNQELPQGTYWSMALVIASLWAVSVVRDVQRLCYEPALRKAAVKETDERYVQIAHRSTHRTVITMAYLLPVAMFVLAWIGRQDLVDALSYEVCLFLMLYLAFWAYISKTS